MFFARKYPPIPPLKSVAGWKEVPIKENGEELVALGPFSEYSRWILQDAIYWGERVTSPYSNGELTGSLVTPFVRRGVAERLVRAAKALPPRHMLLVWDSYRELQVQQSLFDYYVRVLEGQGMHHDQALVEAQRFVSIPSHDPKKPSPHNTGGAVDLTVVHFSEDVWVEMENSTRLLKSKDWQIIYEAELQRLQFLRYWSKPLVMGTAFDQVAPQTATRFYEESPDDLEAQKNRRVLYSAMTNAGFSSYHEEWWHFDFGNQFWAIVNETAARYSMATLSPKNWEWEQMRRSHFQGAQLLRADRILANKFGRAPLSDFIAEVARRTGDLHESHHPHASAL